MFSEYFMITFFEHMLYIQMFVIFRRKNGEIRILGLQ
jgi:hypothetical protein